MDKRWFSAGLVLLLGLALSAPLLAQGGEEPKPEEPKAEEPKAEEPKAEEPKAEAPKAESPWVTDFEKAKAMAKDQNKDVLINFSGSDWCGWCQRLDSEVFSKPEFLNGVGSLFVLCNLDFPRRKPNPDAEKNGKIRDTFGVTGYPAVLLTDALGRLYARTGYQKGGAEAYVTHLKGFLDQKAKRDEILKGLGEPVEEAQQDEKLKAAVKQFVEWKILLSYTKELSALVEKRIEAAETPEAKAATLGKTLNMLKELDKDGMGPIVRFRSLLEKAMEIDPENAFGLKMKYLGDAFQAARIARDTAGMEKYTKLIRELDPQNENGHLEAIVLNDVDGLFRQKKFAEAAQAAETFLSTLKPKKIGAILYWAAGVARFRAGEQDKAKDHMKKLIELYPDSPHAKRAQGIIQQLGG
ncbi:MAG: thioredoxin family protein [Planctomycetota bacterium]